MEKAATQVSSLEPLPPPPPAAVRSRISARAPVQADRSGASQGERRSSEQARPVKRRDVKVSKSMVRPILPKAGLDLELLGLPPLPLAPVQLLSTLNLLPPIPQRTLGAAKAEFDAKAEFEALVHDDRPAAAEELGGYETSLSELALATVGAPTPLGGLLGGSGSSGSLLRDLLGEESNARSAAGPLSDSQILLNDAQLLLSRALGVYDEARFQTLLKKTRSFEEYHLLKAARANAR